MTDKRNERLLEEVLKLPGNQTCADCHAAGPRWASVNLGIILCVTCASIHRKLGTHKSRVKSITLDTWTRDQITSLRSVGNIASNAIYNPNEALNPPPTLTGAEERDSELEKYIRRKYELGAFKAPAPAPAPSGSSSSSRARAEPNSLNRARERDGRISHLGDRDHGDPHNGNGNRSRAFSDTRSGSVTTRIGGLDTSASPWLQKENKRNPELNDVVVRKSTPTSTIPATPGGVPRTVVTSPKDRDLPPLPNERSTLGLGASDARERRSHSDSGYGNGTGHAGGSAGGGRSRVGTNGSEATLIDIGPSSTSSTYNPSSSSASTNGFGGVQSASTGQFQSYQPSSGIPLQSFPPQPQPPPTQMQTNQFNPFMNQYQQSNQLQTGFGLSPNSQVQQMPYQQQQQQQTYGVSPSGMGMNFNPSNPFFQPQSQLQPQSQSTYQPQFQPVPTSGNMNANAVQPNQPVGYGYQGGLAGGGMYVQQQQQHPPQQWGQQAVGSMGSTGMSMGYYGQGRCGS